jgi:hypothetical protein
MDQESLKMGLFSFFSSYKCLVYTAFRHEQYFSIANQLRNHGIRFRTKSYRPHAASPSHQMVGRSDFTQYDIYVKEADQHQALQAIHGK